MILEDQRLRFGLEISRSSVGEDILAMMVYDASSGRQVVCQPEVWIDGFEVPSDRALVRLRGLGSDMLYGVEVYGPRQLPLPSTGGLIGYTKSLGTLVRGGVMQGLRSADTVWRRSPRTTCGAMAVWTTAFVKEMQKAR